MAVVHINRRGDTYYLHQGITKKGNPKYYFSRNDEGHLVESVPEGYEIYENPNARVFLRRRSRFVFTEEEIAIVRDSVKNLSALEDFKIDTKRDAIIVFEPDQDLGSLAKTISLYTGRSIAEMKRILESTITYSPTMKFVLAGEKERVFEVHRMCYIGADADWLFLGAGDLESLAKEYCYHLGRESFYELL